MMNLEQQGTLMTVGAVFCESIAFGKEQTMTNHLSHEASASAAIVQMMGIWAWKAGLQPVRA